VLHQAADLALRRCEVFAQGEWQERKFMELREGNVFRLFEVSGTPVIDEDGTTDWKCVVDARQDDHGIWGVVSVKQRSVRH